MDEMTIDLKEIYLDSKKKFKKLKKALDSNDIKITVDDIIKDNYKLKTCCIFTVAEVLDFCGLVEKGKIQDLLKKLSSCGFKENSHDKLKDCRIIIDAICKAYSDRMSTEYLLFYSDFIKMCEYCVSIYKPLDSSDKSNTI